jgi:hypothetical protein
MGERDYRQEYQAIMRALAESVAEARDGDISEEQDSTDSVEARAERVRECLLGGIKAFRQKRLQSAREQYEQDAERFESTTSFRFPGSLTECRELLRRVLEAKPDLNQALLTAQHREFGSLSDQDVMSYLRDLEELGVLDQFKAQE